MTDNKKENIAIGLIAAWFMMCAILGYLDRPDPIVLPKPCKCDCSYTVHNADSIITAKGDTVAYRWR